MEFTFYHNRTITGHMHSQNFNCKTCGVVVAVAIGDGIDSPLAVVEVHRARRGYGSKRPLCCRVVYVKLLHCRLCGTFGVWLGVVAFAYPAVITLINFFPLITHSLLAPFLYLCSQPYWKANPLDLPGIAPFTLSSADEILAERVLVCSFKFFVIMLNALSVFPSIFP